VGQVPAHAAGHGRQVSVAERYGIDMDRAFTMLRDYARNTNQHLTDVAHDFVTGGSAEFPPPAH
jgi:hypothetical protein